MILDAEITNMLTQETQAAKPEDMHSVADQLLEFAGQLKIFAFKGEMGAGKTTLIKAICSKLGVSQGMSSPTFSIVNEYHSNKGESLFHFDFYRLKTEQEAVDIGVEEYFASGSYCFIEWPENILNLLPDNRVDIIISISEDKRLITFSHD